MFDPFGIHNQINSMLNGFMEDPFAPPTNNRNNRNGNSNGNSNGGNQVSLRNNDPFGRMNVFNSPFASNNMFNNHFALMNQMMQQPMMPSFDTVHADPSSQVFSSSSVMTYSNANGKPKVYQQSYQVQQGPGGVKETRKMVRDSEKGIEKVTLGHHMGDKAHIIERQKNRGGEVEEIVNLENLDEEEVNDFNKEFENKIRQNFGHSSHGGHGSHHHGNHHHHHIGQQQPLAIEDNDHHKKERKSKKPSKH